MGSIEAIVRFLHGQPVIVLFLLIGCGCTLGRIRVAGISLGSIAGTLLVAILFGRFGFKISPGAQAVGFALFIYSVGYQAGPKFVEALKSQGLRYLSLALFVATVAVVTTLVTGSLLKLPLGGNAGLLAGALTSTPTLAAAQAALGSGLVPLPAGWTTQTATASIGASYAITYLVGTLGIVVVVSVLPKLLGLDLEAEAHRLTGPTDPEEAEPLQARAYRVANEEFCRQTIGELAKHLWDDLSTVWIRRDLAWSRPGADDRLRMGDELHAFGYAKFFRGGIERIGPEIRFLREAETAASWTRVVVSNPNAIGKQLHEFKFASRHGLVVYALSRQGHALPVVREHELARGDVLTVAGPAWGIKSLPDLIGPLESDTVETDMTSFAFGIALGAAIGLLSLTVAGIPFSIGMAVGLMLVGVAVGWLNNARPSMGHLPDAARWVLMEFGLLLFIAGVGLNAGATIVETFLSTGPALLLAAVLVVLIPVCLGYAFGRKVLRLEPLVLLGALTGAMTSGPALRLVTRQANSSLPVLGYTGTYALASIILTMAGTLIMYL